jgi:hypothetical protein
MLSLRSDHQILENTKTGSAHEHVCENGGPRGSNTSASRTNEREKIYSSPVVGASRVTSPKAYGYFVRFRSKQIHEQQTNFR